MRWGLIDIRDEVAAFEREHRLWPRSGSVSKPFRKAPRTYQEKADAEREEFEKYHQFGLILEPSDERFLACGLVGIAS